MDAVDDALYCPTCSYNLTGLLENRCPECGREFDPRNARPLMMIGCFKCMGLGSALLHLLIPPAVFMASVYIGVLFQEIGVGAIILGGGFWLIVGIINARKVAWGLAANRAAARGRPVPLKADVRFVVGAGIGLWVSQFFVGFCGCSVVVFTS